MRKLLRRLTGAAAAIGLMVGLGIAGTGTAQASSRWTYWALGYDYGAQSWYNGNCLDDSAQFGLRTYPCNGGVWQKWRVINLDNLGYAQLQNQSTLNCLDWSPQYGLRTFPCYANSFNGGWQKWMMVNRTMPSGPQGFESVLLNGYPNSPNQCLDNSQFGVRGYACNGPSQDAGYQGWSLFM